MVPGPFEGTVVGGGGIGAGPWACCGGGGCGTC